MSRVKVIGSALLASALCSMGCGDKYKTATVQDAAIDAALPDAAVDAALPDAAVDAALPDAAVLPDGPPLGPDGSGIICTSSSECPGNEYCDKVNCIATDGRCVPRPQNCSNTEDPVCSCNGVTFWNDCLRAAAGVVRKGNSACNLLDNSCSVISPCPTSITCAYLFSGQGECAISPSTGQCWVAPADCPAVTSGDYRTCNNPTGPCLPKCEAVKNGGFFYHDMTCPQ